MKTENLIKEFIYECEIKKYSPRTIKNYRNNLLYFEKYLQLNNISNFEDIAIVTIKGYIQSQIQKGCKATYINTIIKVLTSFYNYLYAEKYINDENFIKRVKFVKEDKTLIKTFTDEEVQKMMNVYNNNDYLSIRNKAILAMLFDTGIRNFELCELLKVSIKDNYIIIFGKGNKERIVPKSAYLSKLLFKYEQKRDVYFEYKNANSEYFFLSRTGRKLTIEAVERVVLKAGEQIGINERIRCSPHTCRHYYAQKNILLENDVYTLSKLLGHTNIRTTQIYLQSMQNEDIIKKAVGYSPLMNL